MQFCPIPYHLASIEVKSTPTMTHAAACPPMCASGTSGQRPLRTYIRDICTHGPANPTPLTEFRAVDPSARALSELNPFLRTRVMLNSPT